jgi:transcriptional regulator with XRE-family HTH domain
MDARELDGRAGDRSPDLTALGEKIRERRKANGLTQEGLAKRADLHRTYLADVERGARNVSILNVLRIARGLGVSVSELCDGMR